MKSPFTGAWGTRTGVAYVNSKVYGMHVLTRRGASDPLRCRAPSPEARRTIVGMQGVAGTPGAAAGDARTRSTRPRRTTTGTRWVRPGHAGPLRGRGGYGQATPDHYGGRGGYGQATPDHYGGRGGYGQATPDHYGGRGRYGQATPDHYGGRGRYGHYTPDHYGDAVGTARTRRTTKGGAGGRG